MSSLPIRIATRESPLAMWQAEYVAAELQKHGHETTLVPLLSSGDVDMTPIDGSRQIGVFTKRIQQALVDDEADVAVHSLKDLPTEVDSRFTLAAVPPRESVADCLVSDSFDSIASLPENATVGTGSTRRIAQLKSLRPDLNVVPIRGNVQTRLKKLTDGQVDALILAHAGLLRLGMLDRTKNVLPLETMLPAPGQGALGIEVRSDDRNAASAVKQLDHWPTHAAIIAERTVLAALHGGCLAPIAAYAFWENADDLSAPGSLTLTALVLSPEGKTRLVETERLQIDRDGSPSDWMNLARDVGLSVAGRLRDAGAGELITGSRSVSSDA